MKRLTTRELAAREARLDAEREANLQAFEAFRDKFSGLVFKAVVLWFNASSGEGMVRGLNGEGNWPLYACNIPGAKTWFASTACVAHAVDQIIDVEVKVSYGHSLIVSHTQGSFDKDKWGALDHSNLSFTCDVNGELTSGLFGRGA